MKVSWPTWKYTPVIMSSIPSYIETGGEHLVIKMKSIIALWSWNLYISHIYLNTYHWVGGAVVGVYGILRSLRLDGRMSHLRLPLWFHSWPHSLSTFSCQVAIAMEWNGFMFLLTCVPCFNRLYALRNYKSKRKTSTIRWVCYKI